MKYIYIHGTLHETHLDFNDNNLYGYCMYPTPVYIHIRLLYAHVVWSCFSLYIDLQRACMHLCCIVYKLCNYTSNCYHAVFTCVIWHWASSFGSVTLLAVHTSTPLKLNSYCCEVVVEGINIIITHACSIYTVHAQYCA